MSFLHLSHFLTLQKFYQMTYVKNNSYVDIPFSSETARGDFYTYFNLRDLAERCELLKEDVTRCRTIGIVQSIHGKFFISAIDPEDKTSCPLVRLSVVYLKTPLPSMVIPYPIQVFGSMQWKNRPVIFAKLVQVLNPSIALMMNNTMKSVSSMHLAPPVSKDCVNEDNELEEANMSCSDISLLQSLSFSTFLDSEPLMEQL